MVRRIRPLEPVRVVFDLNTQCDFLLSRGAMPVANRNEIVPRIRRIMDWARVQRVPVISSIDAHRPSESPGVLRRHCVDNTAGQLKLPFTLLPRRLMLASDNTLDVPVDVFNRCRQVILAKRSRDFLTNPKADRLATEMPADYFICFGVAAEICVKSVVLGLIARRRAVVLVSDALGHWNAAEAELSIRQMAAKGAVLVTTDQLVSNALIDVPRAPSIEEVDPDQILLPQRARGVA